jgi:hypothetical protein
MLILAASDRYYGHAINYAGASWAIPVAVRATLQLRLGALAAGSGGQNRQISGSDMNLGSFPAPRGATGGQNRAQGPGLEL